MSPAFKPGAINYYLTGSRNSIMQKKSVVCFIHHCKPL